MKHKLLKISGILVLVIVLAGFWGYNKYFKPDPAIQQQLNNQFGEEFFDSFDDQQTVAKPGTVNDQKPSDDLEKNIDAIIESMQEKSEKQEGKTEKTPTPVNETIAKGQITLEEINNKYKSRFSSLQNVALSRLDTLYSAAIQEYKQNSKTGTLKRSELAQKYIQAGTRLEASLDSQFYSALDEMQSELNSNNLSTDIIDVYKSEYEKAKSAKRSQLLANVRK